jgi:autotransporter adhesin
VDELSNTVEQNRRELNGAIAAAVALGNLPQAVRAGGVMVSVGAGYYKGEAGMAVGVSRRSQSESFTLKASVTSNGRGDAAIGAGAGFEF